MASNKFNFLFNICVLFLFSSCCFLGISKDCDDPIEELEQSKIQIKNVKTITSESKIKVFFKLTNDKDEGIASKTDRDFNLYEKALIANEDENLIDPLEAPRYIVPNPENYSYSTMIVMDLSGSVIDEIEKIKEAAKKYVKNLFDDINSGDLEVSIQYFDGRKELQELIGFSNSESMILDKIDSMNKLLQEDKSTNLYGAIIQSCNLIQNKVKLLKSNPETNIWGTSMVVFSDGKNEVFNNNKSEMNAKINSIERDVDFYVIGAGIDVNRGVLLDIGRKDQFYINNYSELNTALSNILDKIKKEANSNYELEICTAKRGTNVSFRLELKDTFPSSV